MMSPLVTGEYMAHYRPQSSLFVYPCGLILDDSEAVMVSSVVSQWKWRIAGLALALLSLVAVLPLTQPDKGAAVALTAQGLVRAQMSELEEHFASARGEQQRLAVAFSYEGLGEVERAVWQEMAQVASLEASADSATRVSVETERIGDDVLRLVVVFGDHRAEGEQRIGDWKAIVPPLVAILIALFLRQILVAMGAAVWLGAVVYAGGAVGSGTIKAGGYLVSNVTDAFNLYIIGFTFALVGMVQVMIRMGAMAGVLDLFAGFAKSARSTRIATALMGFGIFFDDYANTIVVGSTMRPLSDERRISREKLAYIVDSTSAPIAGLAIISTWIGYEVGLFDDLARQLHLGMSGYEIFFGIIPLRFYCLFALALVLWNVFLARDFGPMLKAEQRAALTGAVLRPGATPLTRASFLSVGPKEGVARRWYNAVIPVTFVVVATMGGMYWSGGSALGDIGSWQAWRDAFSEADGAMVLFWSALLASGLAMGLAIGQRLLSVQEAVGSWLRAVPSMWMAVAILLLAWSIRSVCDDLGTSVYLVGAVEGLITLAMLPLITFAIAAVVAFATGTSWGAMGILLPTLIPLAFQLGDGSPESMLILMLCFAAVLDGAIFGDHCSPISDTTILSSIAAGSDHIDHVRTQMPYAVTAMVAAGGLGYVGVAFGLSPWLVLPVGILGLGLGLRLIGRPSSPSSLPVSHQSAS
jgi:Na+/H+ antiporter NhaC